MLKPILISSLVAVVILTECVLAYFLIPSAADIEARVEEHAAAAADGHGHGDSKSADAKDDKHGAKDDGHGKSTDAHGSKDAHAKPADGHGSKASHGSKPAAKSSHGSGGGHGSSSGGHGGGHGGSTAKVPAGSGTGGEVEVELGKFNLMVHEPASNVTLRISFHLVGTVADEESGEFSGLLEKNQHRLRDQVIFEIRNAQMSDLTDPGLGLIKRRILAKTNDLLGHAILKNVVFSEFSFIEQ